MKTYTSRWVEAERYRLWELRERGAVLATIEARGERFYVWTCADTGGWSHSCYAAQRAVRRALAREQAVQS